jgi:hypothetical protein
MDKMEWPTRLSINAWTGVHGQSIADIDEKARHWGAQERLQAVPRMLAAMEPVDLRDWRHDKVGWGLILPENETLSDKELALAIDAPKPIQDLLADRCQAPVFRYRADLRNRFLRRYYSSRQCQDIAISGSPRGTGEGCLPRYLLIYAPPVKIPWSLQYILNTVSFVGRLDLEGEGLERYVKELLNNWEGASCRSDHPVVWTVDHGKPDISWLMRRAIAQPIAEKLRADEQIGEELRNLAGINATAKVLTETLTDRHPALIITTSHGMTGPLDNLTAMGRQLGMLVDNDYNILSPDILLNEWQPDGAIWYAHACCSAGSDDHTNYKGLVAEGSSVEKTLEAIAALGAMVAPLPSRLLGAEKPLRAFIGQVEPTFDWTLRQVETGQILTSSLQNALYNRMYRKRPEPVGLAFEESYRHVGELFAQWNQALRDVAQRVPDAELMALRTQLTALDRQSMVILGDPTACLPPLS